MLTIGDFVRRLAIVAMTPDIFPAMILGAMMYADSHCRPHNTIYGEHFLRVNFGRVFDDAQTLPFALPLQRQHHFHSDGADQKRHNFGVIWHLQRRGTLPETLQGMLQSLC